MKTTDNPPTTAPESNNTSAQAPTPEGPVPAPRPTATPEWPSPTRPSSSAVCAAMRKLSLPATKTFLTLIDGVAVGEAKKIDNAPRAFMAVSVDHLIGIRPSGGTPGAGVYAVAHRYEVNGDLVSDPDIEFYVVDDATDPTGKAVYPTAVDNGPMGYHRHVELDDAGHPTRFLKRGQADLARFCDRWMRNIASQQRLGQEGR